MDLVQVLKILKHKTGSEILKYASQLQGRAVFSTSFGVEDQVITHLIADASLNIEIFTLDTGRLHDETYAVWAETEKKYGIKIEPFYPDTDSLQELVKGNGINGFYDSLEKRKACCEVRKMEPLARALKDADYWVTGVRREQSVTRAHIQPAELDSKFTVLKFNPLYDWTYSTLWSFVHEHEIPYNKLHDRGFPSIGCAPCTRAIEAGEDIRAGRWWWEEPEHKECGLHISSKTQRSNSWTI